MKQNKKEETFINAWARARDRVEYELQLLLRQAVPNAQKRHKLVKLLKSEIWGASDSSISSMVTEFYSISAEKRTAARALEVLGIRAYPWLLEQLTLDFSNAIVSEIAIAKTASTLSQLAGEVFLAPRELQPLGFMQVVVHGLTHPRWDQPSSGLTYSDFFDKWQDVAFRKFGSAFQEYFESLRAIDEDIKSSPSAVMILADSVNCSVELRQVDLDWMKDILANFQAAKVPPDYPLSRGPIHPVTRRLQVLIRKLQMKHPERIQAIESIASRVCQQCLSLYEQQMAS